MERLSQFVIAGILLAWLALCVFGCAGLHDGYHWDPAKNDWTINTPADDRSQENRANVTKTQTATRWLIIAGILLGAVSIGYLVVAPSIAATYGIKLPKSLGGGGLATGGALIFGGMLVGEAVIYTRQITLGIIWTAIAVGGLVVAHSLWSWWRRPSLGAISQNDVKNISESSNAGIIGGA